MSPTSSLVLFLLISCLLPKPQEAKFCVFCFKKLIEAIEEFEESLKSEMQTLKGGPKIKNPARPMGKKSPMHPINIIMEPQAENPDY
ncbi:unnamed protein product, partial [Iphiclides podalirius]